MRSHYMFNRFLAHTVQASLLVLVGFTIGCESGSPSRPTPLPPAAAWSTKRDRHLAQYRCNRSQCPGDDTRDGIPSGRDGRPRRRCGANHRRQQPDHHRNRPGPRRGDGGRRCHQSRRSERRLTGAFTYVVDPPFTLTSSLNTVTSGSQTERELDGPARRNMGLDRIFQSGRTETKATTTIGGGTPTAWPLEQ